MKSMQEFPNAEDATYQVGINPQQLVSYFESNMYSEERLYLWLYHKLTPVSAKEIRAEIESVVVAVVYKTHEDYSYDYDVLFNMHLVLVLDYRQRTKQNSIHKVVFFTQQTDAQKEFMKELIELSHM